MFRPARIVVVGEVGYLDKATVVIATVVGIWGLVRGLVRGLVKRSDDNFSDTSRKIKLDRVPREVGFRRRDRADRRNRISRVEFIE